jgi:error-prone DNA polymerase
MDLLGLRTLSAVAECLDLIEQTTGTRPDLDALPLDDPAVYAMICDVDTIGLFQIESRAQQQSLYQSQPRCFNDLIVQVAIIRPGPIQGDAVHPYLRRRQGLEPVTYPHPALEPILAETRGVILYQEQILRIHMGTPSYTRTSPQHLRCGIHGTCTGCVARAIASTGGPVATRFHGRGSSMRCTGLSAIRHNTIFLKLENWSRNPSAVRA